MITVNSYTKTTVFGEYDYFLEDYKSLSDLKSIFLPKIQGEWRIIIVDPSLKDAHSILADTDVPSYVNLVLYLPNKKLEKVIENYPEYAHKELNNYEKFKQFISTLKHPISNEAVNYVYKAANGNLEEIQDGVRRIDEECTNQAITLKDVQSEFTYTKRVYTSQVLNDFLFRTRYRFQHYNAWLNELGMSYAYNSMYKTVKNYMKDKVAYLQGKSVKNRTVEQIDAVTLSVLYTLFFNSTNYMQLESLLYQFDTIDNETFRRYLDARLQ